MGWTSADTATAAAALILIAAVILAVRSIISGRKKGRTSCGGDCSHCAMHIMAGCHEEENNRK
ncbi:MAG: FeoB-associated Cys-rich membrane protein [Oscillospiraceae bacterium]|nr:FeoB-associated Cys-rich membrane protein [Oscillospiraceae bacterium]